MAEDVDFDSVAASLHTSGSDLQPLLALLAYKLELALPDRVLVKRRRESLLSSRKQVLRLDVPVGDRTYSMVRARNGTITTSTAHVVRGIALSTDELDADSWLRALVVDLGALARTSERDRLALERELFGPPLTRKENLP
jgi:hypothetical protein